MLQDGTTQVPFRVLFEAMGLKVGWNAEKRLVTGTKDDLSIELTIGSKEAYVNGKKLPLLQPPRIVSGHTLVPLRFVGESTGAIVVWDNKLREITIITEEFAESLGVTMEEMRQLASEWEAQNNSSGTHPDPNPAVPLNPSPSIPAGEVPDKPKGDGTYKPATGEPITLSSLQGMYYGFSDDFGGYECGGICWHYYTFLPGGKVLVGEPPEGGPETIDCKRDGCLSYTISNGSLTLSSGEKLSIKLEKGELVIDDVLLTAVQPAADDLRLDNTFQNITYWGFVGITGFSSSSTEYITFYPNGAFETDSTTLGSFDAGSSVTNSVSTDGSTGTYRIRGNSITFAYNDGRTVHKLFFVQDAPDNLDVQIGGLNFYVDTD
nr:copper amine oxidase N-terminal domain-containing protein [Paenibacillus soyae]